MSDAIEAERKRAIAAIHWVFNADGTVGERAMAQEAIHKINDPTFMTHLTAYEAAKGGGVGVKPLEWERVTENGMEGVVRFWRAATILDGHLWINVLTPDFEGECSLGTVRYSTSAAAMNHLQDKYDAAVRSALTSPASGSGTREEIKGAVGRETEGWPAETDHVPSPASGERDAPQCCMCGKNGLSTTEGDGGAECELADGRWVCSQACYDKAVPMPGGERDAVIEALKNARSFVAVMFGSGPDAIIPETIPTPLGIPVKIGSIMRDVDAALRMEGK